VAVVRAAAVIRAAAGVFGAPAAPEVQGLPIVLISLGIVLALCVGAGTAIIIAGRNKAKETVDTAREAAGSPASAPAAGGGTPTTEPTRQSASTVTVTEPKTLGGRPKLTDAQFAPLADQLESTLTDVPKATSTVGAPIDMAICGWADDGSVGWIMYFFTSVKAAKAEFPKLRAQIEKKSS
jgi:hypothetical protein